MTRVKICGLTRPRDVGIACELGAACVGFNFAAASPRRVPIGAARGLASSAAKGVVKVGVFVDESRDEILAAVEEASLDAVQIHRPLREEDLDLPRPVFAVARVRGGSAVLPPAELLARCRYVLVDSDRAGQSGGTGVPVDWNALSGKSWPIPLMLAGGLNAGNVEDAIETVRPAAVDVASGVESAPGIKDENRMRLFFEAVARADSRR